MLLQAKKLYRAPASSPYKLDNTFSAFNADQLKTLVNLDRRHAAHRYDYPDNLYPWVDCGFSHYLFYCPSIDGYEEGMAERLHYYMVRNGLRSRPSHDYEWSHREEYYADPERHIPGLLVSDIRWLADGVMKSASTRPSAQSAFERMWADVNPLSWFIVYRLLLGCAGSSDNAALAIVRGNETEVNQDNPVLPRYVLTLRIDVGRTASATQ